MTFRSMPCLLPCTLRISLIFLDKPFTKEPIAWAIRKNDPDFMKFLNDFLAKLKADGRFDKILSKMVPQFRMASIYALG